MTPFEIIASIFDAAAPPVRPDIPARISMPKDKTGGARKRGAQTDLPSSKDLAADPVPAPDASESAGEKNFSADSAPPTDAVRERDESPQNALPCADDIAVGNVVEFPPLAGKRRKRKGAKKDSDKSADAAKGDDADAELFKPRAFGFDVDELNEEFALVLLGSKAVVYLEQKAALLDDQQRFLSIDAFLAWFANRFTERVDAAGNIRAVTWAKAWLQSRNRRQYRGVEFFPDPDNQPGTPQYLNLWGGFGIAPARPPAATYKTFRDHLLTNVCRGDDKLFAWVFGFFAHIVQRPRERIGVALVMRGKMGSGKTKIGEVIGSLFPRHYFMVDDPRYVTGQFNAHMATCLLLQADEAVWAGDKSAEGRLKGLITSPIQQIEAKGVDPIRLMNYVRLIMTSNEDWVVPAGKDERRFCVLDVDPRCAQSHDYFAEMDAELAAGGRELLLADLLSFDLESVNLRQIPRTDALLEQKVRSLDSVDGWWFERLMAGTATRRASEWTTIIACSTLFDDYILHSERIGIKRKQDETVVGIKLRKLVPGIRITRRETEITERDERDGTYRTLTKRARCYVLPPLNAARESFEALVGQKVTWPIIEGETDTRGDDDVAF